MTLGEVWERLRALQKLAEAPHDGAFNPDWHRLVEVRAEIARLLADIENYQARMGLRP